MTTTTGLPALAALALGFLAFLVALFAARLRRGDQAVPQRRSPRSLLGILVQGIAIAIVAAAPWVPTLDPLGAPALLQALGVALLMAATVGLFVWASRTMGRNWSIVARTRADHRLVTTGPFAHVRHPIYVVLFLFMLAIAIGLGTWTRLIVAIPLYALGTWQRITVEEGLLRAMFGADYDAYARRVKRFVPGLF
ncbi:MAG TPA: isoprenylcysteine carboxylmethyltransferase family protein [Sphingomonas sp.]|nr:isoprenylcysteine carboxylmethyltransferase family protein [Sphingomonas sp.]